MLNPVPLQDVKIFYNDKWYTTAEIEEALKARTPARAALLRRPTALNVGDATSQTQIQFALIKDLLDHEDKCFELVRWLYHHFSGEDRKLQLHEVQGLAISLGAKIGVVNPSEVFGDVPHMFFRFDVDGSGYLDLHETEKLIQCILRDQFDKCSPPKHGMKLLNIDRKNLNESYTRIRQLGQGGQGSVHLVRDNTSGVERVVKIYSKHDANAPLADIKAEFAILKKLDHPNIARVCEIFEDDASVYVTSEPYFGGDLTVLLTKANENGQAPTVEWIGRIFKQVMGGIAFLHSQYIMHCDLKEPNVMIAHDSSWHAPHVVIIDFGMAKSFCGDRQGGTPGYMPPEVWQSNLWTPKGDIFSFACMVWSIFNGRMGGPFLVSDVPPFTRIKTLTLTMPIDCSRILPLGFAQLIERMADKNLQRRPCAKDGLADPFFQSLDAACSFGSIKPDVIDAMRNAADQSAIQNLLAIDLVEGSNLSQLRSLTRMFQKMDKDMDGTVTAAEARIGLEELNFPEKTVDRLISGLVADDGKILYSAFMAKLLAAKRSFTQADLLQAFKSIDSDGSGLLSLTEIEEFINRPGAAELLGGRSSANILKEMDIDGNGQVDFNEFQRAMLGESKVVLKWQIGNSAMYSSKSHGMQIQCKIIDADIKTGAVMIDIKPGYWISCPEQELLLSRGAAARAASKEHNCSGYGASSASDESVRSMSASWFIGERCQYFSKRQNQMFDAVIVAIDGSNRTVKIDLKPDYWMPPAEQNEVLRRVLGGVQHSGAQSTASLQGTMWSKGDVCKYFSKRQGQSFVAAVVDVQPGTGAVMIDLKPDHWISLAEQALVLSR